MTTKNKSKFVDFELNIKTKLSALWITVMFCYTYGDYFQLYVPSHIDALMNKNTIFDAPYMLVIATCVMILPIMMILLSLLLKPTINRYLNIIIGSIFTLMMLFIAFVSSGLWMAFYILLAVLESIITSIIIWTAYKWPKIQ